MLGEVMHLIDSSNDGSMNDDNWREDGRALAAAAKDGRWNENAVPRPTAEAEAARSDIAIFIIPRIRRSVGCHR